MDGNYSVKFGIEADMSGFTTAMTRAQGSLQTLGKGFDKATKSIEKGTKEWGLDLDKFFDKGTKIFKNFGIDIDKFASHFGMSGKLIAAIAVTTGALAKLGEQVDKMTSAIVKGTGATGKALDGLEQSARNALINGVGRSAEEVGKIVADLNTRFGVTGKELETLTDDIDKFASITDTNATQAVGDLADVMAKWNIDTSEATDLMNQLAYASQASGLSASELMNALQSGQTTFANFGMNITDSIAFLAQLKQNGVDTSSALAGMKVALANFSKEGLNASTAYKEVAESIKNAKSNTEALQIAVETFGARSGAEMVKVLRNGTESAEAFALALNSVGDTLTKTDEASRTSKDALDDLKAVLTGTFGQLGQTITGVFKDILDVVRNVITVFSERLDAVFGVIRTLVTGITGLISDIVAKFTDLMKRLSGNATSRVLNGLKDAFIATFERIRKAIDFFYRMFVIVIDGVKIGFLNLKKAVANILNPIAEDVAKAFNAIIENINKAIEKLNDAIDFLHLPKSWKMQELKLIDPSKVSIDVKAVEKEIKELSDEVAAMADLANKKQKESVIESGDVAIEEYHEVAEVSEETTEEITENAEVAAKTFIDSFREIAPKVKSVFDKINGYISKFVKGIKSAIGGAASLITKAINFNPDEALEGLLVLEDKILTFFVETLPQLPRYLESAFQSVEVMLNNLFSIKGLSDFGGILIDMLAEGINKLSANIGTFVPQLFNVFVDLINKVLEKVPEIVHNLLSGIKTLVVELVRRLPDLLRGFVPSLLNTVLTVLGDLYTYIPTIISELVKSIPRIATGFIKGLTDFLSNLDSEKLGTILSAIVKMFGDIADVLISNIGTIVTELIPAMIKLVGELIGKIPEIIKGAISGIGSAIGEGVQSVASGDFFSNIWNGITTTAGNLWEGVKSVGSGIGNFFKGIFGFAEGTDSAPRGLALVGEQGPELVNFRGGEQVLTNANTQKVLSGAGDNVFNVAFYNTTDTSAYTLIREFKQYNRQMAINGII